MENSKAGTPGPIQRLDYPRRTHNRDASQTVSCETETIGGAIVIHMSKLILWKKRVQTVLLNLLWIIPIGLFIFARTFPEYFDRFWEKLFGK